MASVWPSVALAATSRPSMPPAPGLFSMTTGWPHFAPSLSLMARAMRSSELPGPVGTTMRTGLVGQLCAAAGSATAPSNGRARADRASAQGRFSKVRRCMGVSPDRVLGRAW